MKMSLVSTRRLVGAWSYSWLLYPKIFPPIFFKICQESSSNGSRFLKGYTVQMPPKPVKIRVLVPSVNLRFSMVQSSLICLYTLPSTYMSSLKTHNVKLHSQKPHLIHSQLQGQNGHFAVKSRIVGQHLILSSQSPFDQVLIMISQAWLKNHQDVKSYYFWTVEKSTVSWPGHNFFMVHQKNPIQFWFWRGWHFLQLIFTFQVQEMLS